MASATMASTCRWTAASGVWMAAEAERLGSIWAPLLRHQHWPMPSSTHHSLQLSAKNVGLFEAFYNSIKPVQVREGAFVGHEAIRQHANARQSRCHPRPTPVLFYPAADQPLA